MANAPSVGSTNMGQNLRIAFSIISSLLDQLISQLLQTNGEAGLPGPILPVTLSAFHEKVVM